MKLFLIIFVAIIAAFFAIIILWPLAYIFLVYVGSFVGLFTTKEGKTFLISFGLGTLFIWLPFHLIGLGYVYLPIVLLVVFGGAVLLAKLHTIKKGKQ
jgi:hypothetical protein